MEVGIKAREIAKENFPILDSSLSLETCMKKIKKEGVCVILHKGFLFSVLSYDDLLKALVTNKRHLNLKDIRVRKNFFIVNGDSDLSDVIKLMRKKQIDFVVVKDYDFFGLITKRELVEINQFLFDIIESKKEIII